MRIVICPGIHDASLTQRFLAGLQSDGSLGGSESIANLLVYPADLHPAYSAWHILRFLQERVGTADGQFQEPLLLIGFSAGVVGAIGTAWAWQQRGGRVKAIVALDGWGVPLYGDFPIHRISHDEFTHWSSALLGAGEASFYADPLVGHLELWRSPQTAQGWQLAKASSERVSMTAATFISALLKHYRDSP